MTDYLYLGTVTRPTTEPLTQEAADRLPDGSDVIVEWGGGNGPHRYRVSVGPGGRRYAGELRNDNPLTFVGRERYHNRVWTAPPSEKGPVGP